MLTCPMCKKGVREDNRECPTCRTDLGLLVDYIADLDGTLEKADELTRQGKLGQAVWAYLEVLEVDPDNAEAKRQIGQVVTAVRQFDEVTEGRRWMSRIRKQAKIRKIKEDIVDVTPRGWAILAGSLILMAVMLLVGFGWGFQAGSSVSTPQTSPTGASSSDKDKSTKPTTPDRPKLFTNPKGGVPMGGGKP
jgi:hypothetical protein